MSSRYSLVETLHNGHLGAEESGRCREVETRVDVYGLSAKKVAVVERWPLVEV